MGAGRRTAEHRRHDHRREPKASLQGDAAPQSPCRVSHGCGRATKRWSEAEAVRGGKPEDYRKNAELRQSQIAIGRLKEARQAADENPAIAERGQHNGCNAGCAEMREAP